MRSNSQALDRPVYQFRAEGYAEQQIAHLESLCVGIIRKTKVTGQATHLARMYRMTIQAVWLDNMKMRTICWMSEGQGMV